MASARAGLLLLAFFVGSTGCVRRIELQFPRVEDAASVIFVFAEDGRFTEVYAESLPVYVPVTIGPETEVFASFYSCTLAQLGLAAGRLELGDSAGRALPVSDATFRLDTIDQRWVSISFDEVAAIHLDMPPDRFCPTFQVERKVRLPKADDIEQFAICGVALDGGDVLTWTNVSRPYFIAATSTEAVYRPDLESAKFLNAFQRPGERTSWLIGGRLELGRLEQAPTGELSLTVVTGTRTIDASDSGLDGTPEGPLELYAIGADAALHRFDGTTWSRLALCEDCPAVVHSGVAVAGRGDLYAFMERSAFRIRGDRAEQLALDLGPIGSFTVVAHLAGTELDAVYGASGGRIYRQVRGSWLNVEDALESTADVFVPFEGGIIFGGSGGRFAEYHPDRGLCEGIFDVGHDVTAKLVRESDLVFFGGGQETPGTISFVRPTGRQTRACP